MTHTCERCGKQFTQNKYKKHLQRKRPCKKISPPQNIKLQILPKKNIHHQKTPTHKLTQYLILMDRMLTKLLLSKAIV